MRTPEGFGKLRTVPFAQVRAVRALQNRPHVITRREFFGWSIGVLTFAASPYDLGAGASRTRILRVGTLLDPAREELERGMAFGAAEAARSAMLFGWSVERVSLADAARARRADIHTLILGIAGPLPRHNVPVIRVVCDSERDDDGSFTLAPCAGDGADAWQPTLDRFGAAQLNDRFRAATGAAMTGDAWLGWFAFKVLLESAVRIDSSNSTRLTRHLADPATLFDGHKGTPLRFGDRRRLVQPTYETGTARP
jgi:hypothetical protein